MAYFDDDALRLQEMTEDYFNLGQQALINKYELMAKWGDSVLGCLLTKAYQMGKKAQKSEVCTENEQTL